MPMRNNDRDVMERGKNRSLLDVDCLKSGHVRKKKSDDKTAKWTKQLDGIALWDRGSLNQRMVQTIRSYEHSALSGAHTQLWRLQRTPAVQHVCSCSSTYLEMVIESLRESTCFWWLWMLSLRFIF